jgi:type I restriction enzyme S subunit
MLVRLESVNREKSAYLFGFLQSEAAYRQIASVTYGGSIPHFDEAGVSQVVVPLLDQALASKIVADVLAAVDARDEALTAERGARLEVEAAIEEAA